MHNGFICKTPGKRNTKSSEATLAPYPRGQEGALRASFSHCPNTGLGARHNESAFMLVCIPTQMHLDAKSKQTAFPLSSSVTHH